MYAWSNGTGVYNGNKITQFTSNNEEEFTFNFGYKDQPKKVYIKGDCIISLMKDGKVFKRGYFSFENSQLQNVTDISEILFPQLDGIQKIKFGSSHLLFLSTKGYVYSMGNNYYGQLGINSKMISVIFKPMQLKVGSVHLICKNIHAYKYNSFAIDKNYQLYIWGKNDYLMGIYKSNLFHPALFLGDFKVESIKHSGGRMLIYAHREEEETSYKLATETKEMVEEEEQVEQEEKETKEKDKEKEKEKLKKTKEISKKGFNVDFTNTVKYLLNFIKVIQQDKTYLDNIRGYCLNTNYKFLTAEQITATWNKLGELIKTAIEDRPNSFISHHVRITNSKRLDLLSSLISINILQIFDRIKLPVINQLYIDQLRDCKVLIKSIFKPTDNEKERIYLSNIEKLLTTTLKYKYLENFIHQFAVHQSLLKIFNFKNIMKAFEENVLNTLNEVETKSYLLEKVYENVLMVVAKYSNTIQNMNEMFMNSKGGINDIERLSFEYIINVNENIKNMWMYYTFHSKENILLSLKKKQFEQIYSVCKKIYEVQFRAENVYKEQNQQLTNDNTQWKTNFLSTLDELEKGKNNVIEIIKQNVNESSELMMKQMVTNYSSAVIEEFKLKRMFLCLLASAKKEYQLP